MLEPEFFHFYPSFALGARWKPAAPFVLEIGERYEQILPVALHPADGLRPRQKNKGPLPYLRGAHSLPGPPIQYPGLL